jgi:hypothetical protein
MNEIECVVCGADMSGNKDGLARTFKDDNGVTHLGHRLMICERCLQRGQTLLRRERSAIRHGKTKTV